MNQDLIDYMNKIIAANDAEVIACSNKKVQIDHNILGQQTNIDNLELQRVDMDVIIAQVEQDTIECNEIIVILSA